MKSTPQIPSSVLHLDFPSTRSTVCRYQRSYPCHQLITAHHHVPKPPSHWLTTVRLSVNAALHIKVLADLHRITTSRTPLEDVVDGELAAVDVAAGVQRYAAAVIAAVVPGFTVSISIPTILIFISLSLSLHPSMLQSHYPSPHPLIPKFKTSKLTNQLTKYS